MSSCYDSKMRYVQPEFGRQPTFSSFLPGIAGPWGIPTWCNYNNRGQAVCSFGVQDKDHAILEFTAASTAYQRTALTGFRTFIKENETVAEPFADGTGTMIVEPNALSLSWENRCVSVEAVLHAAQRTDGRSMPKTSGYEHIRSAGSYGASGRPCSHCTLRYPR